MRRWLLVCALGAGVLALPAAAVSPPAELVDTDAMPVAAGQPDIASILVGGGEGVLVLTVRPAGGAWPAGTRIVLYLDTDGSAATGDPEFGGAELRLSADPTERSYLQDRWTAGGYVAVRTPTSLYTSPAGTSFLLTQTVTRLGIVAVAGSDRAPDSGRFVTDVPTTVFVPAPTGIVPAETVALASGTSHAARPRAGRPWTVTFQALRSDTGEYVGHEGLVDCTATIGGRTLHTAHSGFVEVGKGVFRAPAASCTWKLPASAHGKAIQAVVGVQLGTARATSDAVRARVA